TTSPPPRSRPFFPRPSWARTRTLAGSPGPRESPFRHPSEERTEHESPEDTRAALDLDRAAVMGRPCHGRAGRSDDGAGVRRADELRRLLVVRQDRLADIWRPGRPRGPGHGTAH